MRYLLCYPNGYTLGSTKCLHIVVCIAGADCDFSGIVECFRQARGCLPFLLVVPCTFSNTNHLCTDVLAKYRSLYSTEVIRDAEGKGWLPNVRRRLDWDEAGVLAVLKDLEETAGVDSRFFITGFSGGGLLVYRMVLRHPERIAAAVAVCANFNFWGHGYSSARGSVADRTVPIQLVLGQHDPLRAARYGGRLYPSSPVALLGSACVMAVVVWVSARRARRRLWLSGLSMALIVGILWAGRYSGNEFQTDLAARLLADLGYTNVRRIVLPGLGHDPAPHFVLRTFAKVESEDLRRRPAKE
jgi:hypothetical protein